MKKNMLFSVLVFSMCIVLSFTSLGAAKTRHLKFSTAVSEHSTWQEGALKFKELIEKRTDGKYVVDIYTSDQLTAGNQIKALEMLQLGAVEFDIRSILLYTCLDPKFSAIMMPWMVPSYEAADKALAGAGGKTIFELVRKKGMVPLAFGESGFRQITNNVHAIKSPSDMEGIKLRVPAIKMFFSMFKALGCDPTTLNMGEVFTALQQGIVDGQENPVDVIASFRVEEVQKHITLWNASYDPIVMSTSRKFWKSLSDEEKKIFNDSAVEAMAYQKKMARKKRDEVIEYFKTKMEVTELSDEQVATFRKTVQPVYDEWEEKIGIDILKQFGYEK